MQVVIKFNLISRLKARSVFEDANYCVNRRHILHYKKERSVARIYFILVLLCILAFVLKIELSGMKITMYLQRSEERDVSVPVWPTFLLCNSSRYK